MLIFLRFERLLCSLFFCNQPTPFTYSRFHSYIHPMKYLIVTLLCLPIWLFAQSGDSEVQLAQAYYTDAEYEKALEVYQKLYKQNNAEVLYIERILDCHIRLKQEKEALDFIDKIIKKNPGEPQWIAQKGDVYLLSNKPNDAKKLWDDLISKKLKDAYGFASVGEWFARTGKSDEAIKTYVQGRKVLSNADAFTYELAEVYARKQAYDLATKEYLNLFQQRQDLMGYVKVQILKLVNDNSKETIEKALLDVVQKNMQNIPIREMLIDFYLETKNFQEALVQTRSIDRLLKENGERVFRLATTFQANKLFDISNKALDYIIENHSQSPYYFSAWNEKSVNTEMKAFEKKPLDTADIREAILVYAQLETQFGKNISFYNAFLRKANLQIFYMNEPDAGKQTLETMVSMPLNPVQKGEVNLLLGDVLLIQGDYNASRLKYEEVETYFKQDQMGAKAKYKGALLSYYKGDFEMASARLKTLKENTSNDIANDAIRLNLRIQDNIGLDSTTEAMELFASAQLLAFQNRNSEAFAIFDSILFQFPNHMLKDDILWEKAQMHLKVMDLDKAIAYLERILADHGSDILADDALFTLAEIEEIHRGNKEKASALYLRILTEYPGSLFKVEARKRIRMLRGES